MEEALLCEVLSAWAKLHEETPRSCTDIFDELPCPIDNMSVLEVTRYA